MNSENNPYRACTLCPRRCRVNRLSGELGFCGQDADLRIAFAGIHRGEEPPVSIVSNQYTGSGTVFISGCTLGCSFCQNRQISRDQAEEVFPYTGMGRKVTDTEFIDICLALQRRGAANINIVSGTQYIPSLAEGLRKSRAAGLRIPTVWNTSSFENAWGLSLIVPFIDIFLADLKWVSDSSGRSYCGTSAYSRAAKETLIGISRSRPLIYRDGNLQSGTIVRHLVMPGEIEESVRVLRWFADTLREHAILSLLVQFVDTAQEKAGSGSYLSQREYQYLLQVLDDLGIEDGFIQEPETDSLTNWIPDFTRENPFPESFCDPVWHWSKGLVMG